ncbi:LysR substrate-binding domain-containing protein [Acidovorax sp. Root70]|uniref:LysR family transcriptional regulator n=1 Tax=Acidovorax sp. Root70 TaxID=1736590 RepID=UPI0006F9A9FA|nr:LysR substrate-binding domain-containing protein [Acidovorax sp. Root70]KRB39336.1 LysR family transcriptional regulator [Acidovorax sp. Root70]
MDLRSLRYFIAVVEAGSLSRAAGSLYIAQPALTAQIKKLESELGAQLLERSHIGVTPTQAGVQLYQDARRLLSDASAMRERIQRLPQGPEGSITIALPFLLASLLMGPLLAHLKDTHPRIRVFVLDDLSLMVKKAMLDRRAEIGILVDTHQAEGLVCQPFAREFMYFCGQDSSGSVRALLQPPPAYGQAPTPATRPDIDFAAAAAQPLVLQSRRFSIRQQVEDAGTLRGTALNVAHEHDSARVIRSLYACGAGFTFTPACALSDTPSLGSDWLVARVVNPEMIRTYTLATSPERDRDSGTDAVMQAVLQALAAVAQRLVITGRWDAEIVQPATPP